MNESRWRVQGGLEYAGMGDGAIVAILVGLVILDLAASHFEILWHKPNRRVGMERLESRVSLVLAAAGLALIAYALSQGRLWPAAVLAFSVFVLLSNRRTRQGWERGP